MGHRGRFQGHDEGEGHWCIVTEIIEISSNVKCGNIMFWKKMCLQSNFFETAEVGINGIFVLLQMQIICQQSPIK